MAQKKGALKDMNWVGIVLLAFSGASVYLLPYARSTYYDPLINGLGVTNTELGMIAGFFGLLTVICYFPGGWLADRFSARKLLIVCFSANCLLGFWYSTLPNFKIVIFIHVLFGVFCTLTFWAAFIKATRLCAPPESQGKAFGFVEGIRRIMATGLGLTGAWLLSYFGTDTDAGLRAALMFHAGTCGVVAVILFFFMKETDSSDINKMGASLSDILKVAKIKEIWLIAAIILCAYTSYRSQEIMTPYSTNLCGISAAAGATVATIRFYGMGFGAIAGGMLGDKIGSANTMVFGFVVVIITNILFLLFPSTPATLWVFLSLMFTFMLAHFFMRGVYYALLTEGLVPVAATGIATGIVATFAYLPDFYAPLYQGALLDKYGRDAYTGYNYVFTISMISAAIGIGLCFFFKAQVRRKIASGVTLESASRNL